MLNPDLNLDQLRKDYAVDQRVQIDDLLKPEIASAVTNCLHSEVVYQYVLFSQGENHVLTEEQMAAKGKEKRQAMVQELANLASRGIGYLYVTHRMEDENSEATPDVLMELFQFMNSETLLDFVAAITGDSKIHQASGQFNRFTRGQYITRHKDEFGEQGRRLAYELNLTPEWHPDWGGLMQFYEQSGKPRDAWEPRFNRLSLFSVDHIRSITYVAPYAGNQRYSLTGWFKG